MGLTDYVPFRSSADDCAMRQVPATVNMLSSTSEINLHMPGVSGVNIFGGPQQRLTHNNFK